MSTPVDAPGFDSTVRQLCPCSHRRPAQAQSALIPACRQIQRGLPCCGRRRSGAHAGQQQSRSTAWAAGGPSWGRRGGRGRGVLAGRQGVPERRARHAAGPRRGRAVRRVRAPPHALPRAGAHLFRTSMFGLNTLGVLSGYVRHRTRFREQARASLGTACSGTTHWMCCRGTGATARASASRRAPVQDQHAWR